MLRIDPSGTTGLARRFAGAITARVRLLAEAVAHLVEGEDAFGLEPAQQFTVNAWSDAAREAAKLARERLHALPEAEEGYRHFDGFPGHEKPSQVRMKHLGFKGMGSLITLPVDEDLAKHGRVQELDPAKVHYTQSSVIREAVGRKIDGEETTFQGHKAELPVVVKLGDEYHLQEGNHRAAADVLKTGKLHARVVEATITGKKVRKTRWSPPPPVANLVANAEKGAWKFLPAEDKVRRFDAWLRDATRRELLAQEGKDPWTLPYAAAAFEKGARRAFLDTGGRPVVGLPAFFGGAGLGIDPVRVFMSNPANVAKVRFLATRAYQDLEGLSAVAATKLNQILAAGMVKGTNPKKLAREMVDAIDGLSRQRALLIARTEVVAAHATGQLDAFRALGVEGVGVMAEWVTAGDDRVCESCGKLEGTILTLDEARGLIPFHPSCRCSWIPAVEVKKRDRLKKAAKNLLAAIAAERPKLSKKKALARSSWAGKELARKLKKRGLTSNTVRTLPSGKFRLYSKGRGGARAKNLGTFGSRAGEEKHEREVDYFKSRGPTTNEVEAFERAWEQAARENGPDAPPPLLGLLIQNGVIEAPETLESRLREDLRWNLGTLDLEVLEVAREFVLFNCGEKLYEQRIRREGESVYELRGSPEEV